MKESKTFKKYHELICVICVVLGGLSWHFRDFTLTFNETRIIERGSFPLYVAWIMIALILVNHWRVYKAMERVVEEQNAQLAEYEKLRAEQEHRYNCLKGERDELDEDYDLLEDKVAEKQAKIRELESEAETTQVILRNKEAAIKYYERTVQTLRDAIALLERQLHEQIETSEADHCIAMRAHGELITAQADIKALNQIIGDQDHEIRDFIDSAKEQAQKQRILESDIKTLQSKVSKLQNQLAMKEETIKRQLTQISALKIGKEALEREQKGSGRANAKHRERSIGELLKKITILTEDYERDQQKIQELEGQLEERNVECEALTDKCQLLQKDVAETEQRMEELTRRHQDLGKDMSQILSENQKLSEKVFKLGRVETLARDLHCCMTMQQQSLHLDRLGNLIQNEEADDNEFTALADSLRAEVTEATNALLKYVSTNQQLEEHNQKLGGQLNEQAKHVEQLVARISELEKERGSLLADMASSDVQCKKLEFQLETLQKASSGANTGN